MTVAECRSRQAILRISNAELARRAGLDENTVGDCLNGRTDYRRSTLDAIEAALTAAERETLERLSELRPQRAAGASA